MYLGVQTDPVMLFGAGRLRELYIGIGQAAYPLANSRLPGSDERLEAMTDWGKFECHANVVLSKSDRDYAVIALG